MKAMFRGLAALFCVILACSQYACVPNTSAQKERLLREVSLIREFNDAFPSTINSILASGTKHPVWSSKTLLCGRYMLKMQAPIFFNARNDMEVAVEKAKFYLIEVESIDSAGVNTAYTSNQKVFGPDSWSELKKSNFDFSSIGYKMRKDQPVENLERYWRDG